MKPTPLDSWPATGLLPLLPGLLGLGAPMAAAGRARAADGGGDCGLGEQRVSDLLRSSRTGACIGYRRGGQRGTAVLTTRPGPSWRPARSRARSGAAGPESRLGGRRPAPAARATRRRDARSPVRGRWRAACARGGRAGRCPARRPSRCGRRRARGDGDGTGSDRPGRAASLAPAPRLRPPATPARFAACTDARRPGAGALTSRASARAAAPAAWPAAGALGRRRRGSAPAARPASSTVRAGVCLGSSWFGQRDADGVERRA